MSNVVFWDMMMPCGSYKNRHFGGTYRFHHQAEILWVSLVYSEDIPHVGRRRYRCNRFSSPSVVRYILAVDQGDPESFTLKM
jgi:hypothetical protein